jgi:hypothetical protein
VDDYKPPSTLAQYWGLAAAFVLVVIAVTVYFYKLPRTPLYIEPATQSVYIDPISQNAPPAYQSVPPTEKPAQRPSAPLHR